MSHEPGPIPTLVSVDMTQPYVGLRPVVVQNCQRPGGAWETLGALSRLIGELIASAPTGPIRDALEADAVLVIKKYILITPPPAPSDVTLTDEGPSTLAH